MQINPHDVKALLEWRDAVMRTCPFLGMLSHERGAYLLLCKAVGHIPEIGGVKKPEYLEHLPDVEFPKPDFEFIIPTIGNESSAE